MLRSCAELWFAMAVIAALPVQAQATRESEVRDLRQRLEQLEKQLHARDKPAEQRTKVTEIGSRPRTVEPQLVVRVYDVGDLFVLAPRYEARRDSEPGSRSLYLFVEASVQELRDEPRQVRPAEEASPAGESDQP